MSPSRTVHTGSCTWAPVTKGAEGTPMHSTNFLRMPHRAWGSRHVAHRVQREHGSTGHPKPPLSPLIFPQHSPLSAPPPTSSPRSPPPNPATYRHVGGWNAGDHLSSPRGAVDAWGDGQQQGPGTEPAPRTSSPTQLSVHIMRSNVDAPNPQTRTMDVITQTANVGG
jgi:hypothetical protein